MSALKEKMALQNRTYIVDDIATILGISCTTAYKLVKSSAFKIICISRHSFEEWLEMEKLEKKLNIVQNRHRL